MVLIRVFGTPVRAKGMVLVNVVGLLAIVTWLGLYWHPGRGFWASLLIGFASTILMLVADFGHALSHIFSARHAGAPMDEVLLSGGMPRTVYSDNAVSPRAHRMRAMGGPIFSAVGLLVSMAILGLASSGSIVRELAGWSVAGHGFILIGSLLPLPIVDGGAILKWTLVSRGRTEAEADEFVRRVNRVLGIVAAIGGIGLMVVGQWIGGLVLAGAGVVIVLITTGKIR